ncbi:MAG: BatA and WFA domain-containing protein [Bryobacteraceae bacterium]
MNFLNLGLGELLGLAGLLSAGIVALYLLDRSKRRHVVGTLRFWVASQSPTEFRRSRKVQQPWSLLLQIVSTLLLLFAIAGPRLGSSNGARNHVLILDTSAWMGARARQGILLDQAKAQALSFMSGLPADDQVMLVRADALATPVTPFSTSREAVIAAIQQSQPSASALNLQQALDFADHSQKLQAARPGDIVFAGAARVSREDAEGITPPTNLRLLLIPSAGENVGLRRFGVRRAASDPDSLDVFVALRNDGSRPRDVILELLMQKKVVASKSVALAPGSESESSFVFKREGDGPLLARVRSTNGRGDSFPQDDSAVLDLPPDTKATLTVYTDEPELLRPLLTGNPRVTVSFLPPAKYDPQAKADVVLFDRFAPPAAPTNINVIWMDPPKGSPFTVKAEQANARLQNWHSDHPLAQGLFTRDVELPAAKVFTLAQGDQAVADVAQGPVVVARAGTVKMAALGFNPVKSNMRFELATPLLMANILRWMEPEAFRESDVQASTVGTMSVALEKGTNPNSVHVVDGSKRPLPFTLDGNTLHFFSGAPGAVHLQTGARESVYSLTVPDVAEATWKPAAGVRRGVPGLGSGGTSSPALWPWLASLGAIGFLVEWFLYGRNSVMRVVPRASIKEVFKLPWRKAS